MASAERDYLVDYGTRVETISHVRSTKAMLEQRRAELLTQLECAMDWGDYKMRLGRLRGIDDALQICIDVENKLRGN